jgi:hypothetical protein
MKTAPRNPIYVALLEVAPLNGCEIVSNSSRGAVVRCYVAAPSEDAAIYRANESLSQHLLRLTNVEWCVDEAAVEWENPGDPTAAEFIAKARNSDNVVFGEFHVWS